MSESEDKEKKAYEARMQRRVRILKEQLQDGKVKFSTASGMDESLKAVRYAPDGSVDLRTVDGVVRALALSVEFIHDREQMKKNLPLSEIQNNYFAFLENTFGEFYCTAIERGLTPHDAGVVLTHNKSTIEKVIKSLPTFLDTIEEFWTHAADAAHAHIEDMRGVLKGVFGGDLFPSHCENIASKCGLYVDTLVLPDPFMRSKELFSHFAPERQVYYLVKHALNLLQYKRLACADLNPPVVVILPDRFAIEQGEKDFFNKLGQTDALVHTGKIFGRSFGSFQEMLDFVRPLDTVDRVVAQVVDESRVLFDAECIGDIRAQIAGAAIRIPAELLDTRHPGMLIVSQSVGRMSVSNELLVKARRLGGTPVIDAPTSWQYFVWKLQYDADNIERESNIQDLHILRGLQSLRENGMEWLGQVPPEALIEVRKSGAISEIRQIIGKGIAEMSLANPTDFNKSTDRILKNIHAAFDEHRRMIKELSAKKWKFAGTDVGSWLVVGSLAVTAAATGQPVWGLAAIAADQLLAAPKLRDIPKSIRELAKENQQLRQSPVGILFKYGGRTV